MLKRSYWGGLILSLVYFSCVQSSAADNPDAGEVNQPFPRIIQAYNELKSKDVRTWLEQEKVMSRALSSEYFKVWEHNNSEKYGGKKGGDLHFDPVARVARNKETLKIDTIFFTQNLKFIETHGENLDLDEHLKGLLNWATDLLRRMEAREFEAKPE
jgi:hypothetical protein